MESNASKCYNTSWHTRICRTLWRLEKRGELKRISVEVDPELEITEIADRVMRAGGPALLFEKVKGSAYPLLINAMGSERRMAMAFGAASLDAKAAEIEDLIAWAWKQLRGFNIF